jgi:hypothetical protein
MGCNISSLKKNKVFCKKTKSVKNNIEINENNYLYWDDKHIIRKPDKIIDFDDISYKGTDEIM